MGRKTIYQHQLFIPPLDSFMKKYYYLISLLLFEYVANGYYEDRMEIRGFSSEEVTFLCDILPFFYREENILKADDFDTSVLEKMGRFLPAEQQEFLVDHIILSSIDRADSLRDFSANLTANLSKFGNGLPVEYLSKLDFLEFFKGENSTFMNKYYSTKEDKDEILLRFGLK